MAATKRNSSPPARQPRASAGASVRVSTKPRTFTRTLADLADRLRSVTEHAPCVVFDLQRTRSGDIRFTGIDDHCEQLLLLKTEDAMSSFTSFYEILDPAERQRFEEILAIAATKRQPVIWTGKLRARGKQKARWIKLQSDRPKTQAGIVRWRGIITDISHEHDLEASLKRSREQLSELSSYLEAGKEEERERIARDIHDELGSLLVAIKIEAALLTSKLPDNLAGLSERSRSMEALLDQAMGTASRVARELRPGILKEFGLAAAIECQAEDFSQRTGITCRAQCDDEALDVEERCALAVFRIVQEALTNVAKHAHASLVALRLYRNRQQLIVEIRDNGRGISQFDLQKTKSFGLRGIKERVRSLHGELNIGPGEQGGTHIVLSLPLKHARRSNKVDADVQHKLF